MELAALCHGIRLQEEARRAVLDFWREADRDRLAPALALLRRMDTEAQGRAALEDLLGEDRRQYRLLACMLSCGADLHAWYGERGIPDHVYFATMGCFPRFLEECRQITGVPAFDRGWWTARQISGTLFRLGELEYELRTGDGGPLDQRPYPLGRGADPGQVRQVPGLGPVLFRGPLPGLGRRALSVPLLAAGPGAGGAAAAGVPDSGLSAPVPAGGDGDRGQGVHALDLPPGPRRFSDGPARGHHPTAKFKAPPAGGRRTQHRPGRAGIAKRDRTAGPVSQYSF